MIILKDGEVCPYANECPHNTIHSVCYGSIADRGNEFSCEFVEYRWIGVDLDETLAVYDKPNGLKVIGKPIPKMVNRVKRWITEGETVKIFTARVSEYTCNIVGEKREDVIKAIQEWTLKHIGKKLEVTNEKDHGMIELWDDRCIQVEPNTGERKLRMIKM
jgi:hypothetical protein